MGALAALVVKDIREVATSRYFLASLVAGFVVLVALGAAVGASFREAAAEMQKFAVVVNQTTRLGEVYVEELRRLGGDVYEAFSPDLLQRYIYVVVVPPNFTFPSRVEVYAKYRGLLSVAAPPAVERAAAEAARRMGLPPRLVNVTTLLNLDGVCLSGADLALLNSLFLVTWLFMVVVPLSVATTAAVAIGIEKEKKTFELILATPATPGVLVAAKLISSTALALLQLAVTAAGMLIYLANVGAGVAASAQAAAEVRQLPLFVFSPTLLLPVVLSTLGWRWPWSPFRFSWPRRRRT
jgi:ABC-2 type transport system permease protein